MYVFKIEQDHLDSGENSRQGKVFGNGMRWADRDQFERQVITVYDDDDNLYYTIGFYGDQDEESIFAPLDWAAYDAGASYCKVNGEIL